MTKQLLFYEQVVPVSVQRHRDWSLDATTDYEFASHTNSVPLVVAEFAAAAAEYAIVFTGTEAAVQPAVILGLKPDENVYVGEQGNWNARYIPAFVRRYPFVMSGTEGQSQFTLCIDEQHSGWNQGDRGKRLYDAMGKRTEYLDEMLRFVQDYQRQYDRTQAFVGILKDLGLLEPMTARFKLASDKEAQLAGFLAIDRDKLKALPGDELAKLTKTDELELMYIHLQSMRNLGGMLERVTGHKEESESLLEVAGAKAEEPLH